MNTERPTPEQNQDITMLVKSISALFSLTGVDKAIAITALGEVMIVGFISMVDKVPPEEVKKVYSSFMDMLKRQGLEAIDIVSKKEVKKPIDPVVLSFNKGKLN